MEFKLFGPGGSPSSHFRKDLKVLLDLDDEAWEVLANWFLTTNDFDSEQASPAVAASTLLPEQFTESADVLKYILESWYMYGLQLPEIQRDLLLLNCPRERIERLGSLLERLRPARDRVYRDYMRFDHENAVLPTPGGHKCGLRLAPCFRRHSVSHTGGAPGAAHQASGVQLHGAN